MCPKQRKVTRIHLDQDIGYDLHTSQLLRSVKRNPLFKFWDNISVSSSRLKKSKKVAFFLDFFASGVLSWQVQKFKRDFNSRGHIDCSSTPVFQSHERNPKHYTGKHRRLTQQLMIRMWQKQRQVQINIMFLFTDHRVGDFPWKHA
jgi:hypothetical protein